LHFVGQDDYGRPVPATTSTLRSRIHVALKQSDGGAGSRRWQSFHLLALGAGLLAVTLSSVDDLPEFIDRLTSIVIVLVAAVFLVEYGLRLWTAPESTRYAGSSEIAARIRWALSATGLIGLLAIVPAFAISVSAVRTDSDLAALFCFLWILKLGVHAPAMGTLARVISNERATLASVLIVFIIVLVSAATATSFFERAQQPDAFGSLPASLWWAVVTLTTTGYGDVVPHTVAGKMVGSVVMVSGILVLALMTGILATGFSEEERRREYLRVWDQVVKVPMFAELGTVTLS
jgi:voltage-gated potassium channel